MSEPVWLSAELGFALHDRLLADFGGTQGIRDQGLVDSALERPKQLYSYGNDRLIELAAAYAVGMIRNHPFFDGNKRVGFMLAYVFLARNGYRLLASEAESTRAVLDLAAGSLFEEGFVRWLESRVELTERLS